jgi:hypothetical protein
VGHTLRRKPSSTISKAAEPNKQAHFAISRHAPPRGGFLFRSAHHSLKSPVCSCVSITVPAAIVNANHSIM